MLYPCRGCLLIQTTSHRCTSGCFTFFHRMGDRRAASVTAVTACSVGLTAAAVWALGGPNPGNAIGAASDTVAVMAATCSDASKPELVLDQ